MEYEPLIRDLFSGLLWMIVIGWILGIAATIFWVWMLVDVLTSVRPFDEKVLWVLVIFFFHFIGALIYFIMKRSDRPKLVHHH